jgi:hypothetical protein
MNAIWLNGQLGIDLFKPGEPAGSVTLNDPLDADIGPNGLQNFPVLTNLTISGGLLRVQGELHSLPLRSLPHRSLCCRLAGPIGLWRRPAFPQREQRRCLR